MFVIRPKGISSTPRQIARELGCQSRRWPNRRQDFQPDYERDFLMTPVGPQDMRNAPPEYNQTYYFGRRSKYGQREVLRHAGVPIPNCAATPDAAAGLTGELFVVRPLRHSGGRDYRVTEDRLQFVAGEEYISELYPKRREYRVIFVFGQPLIWMRKKPNEGVDQRSPWGHENSRFQTIIDTAASPLSRTDAVARLSVFPPIRGAHIAAADILWAGQQRPEQPYAVLELNFAPGLDIDNNRARVVQCIRNRHIPVPVPEPEPELVPDLSDEALADLPPTVPEQVARVWPQDTQQAWDSYIRRMS